ncbi:competence protein A [mine drainage metagenome]|uniref:Competence protein A n=1 Tax=mine drainage metagenome TaxID=410659 RepID=A0A1J5Q9C5_9ZZZZ
MRFFTERKRPGWLALGTTNRGACVAHVAGMRSGKPAVQLCELRPEMLSDAAGARSLVNRFELAMRHCALLLNVHEYQLLQVEAPAVPEAELKQAVRWKLKDMIDYPVEQATLDVLDIPGDASSPARVRYVHAVAARSGLIRDYMERLMVHGGAALEAIDIPEMAQRNVAARLEESGHGLAMLSFSDDGGLLTFTAGGELFYARQIETGLPQLMVDDEERRSQTFDRVALELQRSLDSFERQFPHVGVNRLLLAPFPARAEFREFLASYLGLRVETFDLADVFDFGSVAAPDGLDVQAQMFGVLGAALRGCAA